MLPLLAFGLSGCAATKNLFGLGEREVVTATADDPGQVIEPEVERRKIKEPKIDTEDFEIGAYAGIIGIEDFESEVVYGVRLAYHVTEGFFVEGTVGQSEAGQTSFERLSGGAPILSDDDRMFTYYNLNLGYNILPGEVFFWRRQGVQHEPLSHGGARCDDVRGRRSVHRQLRRGLPVSAERLGCYSFGRARPLIRYRYSRRG